MLCEAPAAPKAPGFHTTAREPKRAHFRAPALQTPPKFHEKTPRETPRERNGDGRGKKKREILGPHPSGPHPSGPNFSGFGGPTLLGPTRGGSQKSETPIWAKVGMAKVGHLVLAKVGLAKVGQIRMAKVGQIFLAKVGLAKVGFGQSRPIRMAKVGLAKVGLSRFSHFSFHIHRPEIKSAIQKLLSVIPQFP